MANLSELVKFYNPWYENEDFSFVEAKLHKRSVYKKIKESLEKELITSIVGLRRIGKTTIIKQLINELLQTKLNKNKIFFFEFDDKNNNLEELLNFYFTNILREEPYQAKCFIFLDELQFVSGWQTILKRYVDMNTQVKFVVSGSIHLHLHKETKESLAGRIIDFQLYPLSWREFLYLKYGKSEFLLDTEKNNFFENCKKQTELLLYKKDFLSFISYGEFPFFFKEKNFFALDDYYKNSILEKIFAHDIDFFDVENRRAFRELFMVLSKDSAEEINLQNISREIGLSVVTIKKYLEILNKMFLHSCVFKDTDLREQLMSFKKGFVGSLNLARVTLNRDYHSLENTEMGHVIETFVYNELVKNNFNSIFFYADKRIKKEVDFVVIENGEKIPIEVKIAEKIENKKLNNLLFYAKKNNLDKAIMLYGGEKVEEITIENINITLLPYWLI